MKIYLYTSLALIVSLIISLISAKTKISELQHEVEKWERIFNS